MLNVNNRGALNTQNKRGLILMDECDGVSAGDRGGIQQLIAIIKNTTIPIICIVNDRQHQKIKSLANHCYDLEFKPPAKIEIKRRVQQILQAERLSIQPEE